MRPPPRLHPDPSRPGTLVWTLGADALGVTPASDAGIVLKITLK